MDIVLFLKKFHFITTPIGLIVCLTAVAILFYPSRFKRLSIGIAFTSLVFLWVCSTPWVAILTYKQLISEAVVEVPFSEITSADAIVVFAWLKPIDKSNYQILRNFPAPKLGNVKSLYDKLNVPIFVGASQFPAVEQPAITEITFAEQYLFSLGIPHDSIFISTPSRSSHEGVVTVKKMLDDSQQDITKIVLVESDMRMPRKYLSLKKLYEGEEIEIIPFSNDGARTMEYPNYQFQQWVPSLWAIELMTEMLHEWFGLQAHKLIGWI